MAEEAFTGTFPVYMMKFKIGVKGVASAEETDLKAVAELESLGFSIEGTTEEWTSMDAEGWANAAMTGKKFSIDLKGKRCVGDEGNDYIAGLAWKNGPECDSKGSIEFPNGDKLTFNCVVDVTNTGGGDSTNLAPLEFKVIGKGKPTYTPKPSTLKSNA